MSGMNIDIRTELERYNWIRPRWSADKLIAASPFRYDHMPSFFVNLDPESEYYGVWTDSGAVDDEWRSGGIVKLLAFLRNETLSEAYEYLRMSYGLSVDSDEIVALNMPKLAISERKKPLDVRAISEYMFRSPYLGDRGITEAVQRLCNVGYDRRSRAVTIPWYDAMGRLMTIKYRRTDSKVFWYAKDSWPIRELVYGIHIVYQRRIKRAAIVEAEIDAMTLMSAGIPAIAVGGTSFTDYKRDAIVKSPLDEVIVLRDNDGAGRALQRKIIVELSPYVNVKIATVPGRYKDVNELAVKSSLDYVKAVVERAKTLRRINTFDIFEYPNI